MPWWTSFPPSPTFYMEKDKTINKQNKPPTTTNDTIASKEATTKDRPQDMNTKSGGDDSILNYIDVIHDSIQQQNEQLSALLEKTKTLRLSQESVPSGFSNDSPLSDEELDITVISSSQSGESSQKTAKNTPNETCVESQIQEGSSSVTSDAKSLDRQDTILVGTGRKSTSNPTSHDGVEPKEAKARRGYKRSINYCKKFIGRDPAHITERERILIKMNLKVIAKFEKNHPHLPSCSLNQILLTLPPPNINSRANSSIVQPTVENPAEVSKSTTDSKATPAVVHAVTPNAGPAGSSTPKCRDRKVKKPEPVIAAASTVPTEADTPSRSALKRGRSTEEPHPEAKKVSKAPASRPLPTTSTSSVSKSLVTKPPPTGPSSSKPDKAHKGEVKSQTAGQAGRKRKYSQTIYPDNLRVAIIDRAEPEGKISDSRWLLFEDRLRELVFTGEGDPRRMQFGSATLYRGAKVMCCENQESKDYLVTAVSGFRDLWQGCDLAAVSLKDIPCRRVLTAWVPPPSVDPARILTILGKQNPNLKTDSWRLVSSTTEGGGLVIKVSMDKDGQEYLQARGGKLHFGAGWIRFRLTH
ncbi:uncharacterized protein LOC131805585 [Musca domestica]|uniref:Uncharacterized protein LOC131805585 n=2 Tax=Musca domestica TaxID=7370 RepID=A0ABM3VGG8_MUSDO|nr:uncharacterized protein LOC131805585 [Musca domestica]XP_058984889.1 uncharacterized protein LOC131805585 [Musca domestica]XP_058984890.1 uncharacterized protein LOC131805585 [Musca domestica]